MREHTQLEGALIYLPFQVIVNAIAALWPFLFVWLTFWRGQVIFPGHFTLLTRKLNGGHSCQTIVRFVCVFPVR